MNDQSTNGGPCGAEAVAQSAAGRDLGAAIEILQRALSIAIQEAYGAGAQRAAIRSDGPPEIEPPVSLADERREALTTDIAAWHLGRKPQTLRAWACSERGPIRPMRVAGRLMWRTEDLRRVIVQQAAGSV